MHMATRTPPAALTKQKSPDKGLNSMAKNSRQPTKTILYPKKMAKQAKVAALKDQQIAAKIAQIDKLENEVGHLELLLQVW